MPVWSYRVGGICCHSNLNDPVIVVVNVEMHVCEDKMMLGTRQLLQLPNEPPDREIIIHHLKIVVFADSLTSPTHTLG